MHDPLPASPSLLSSLSAPLSAPPFSLRTLPFHAHEILSAAILYTLVSQYISPSLSARLLPHTYPSFPRRTRINWDIHVTSLVQSTLICSTALWVLINDEEVRGDGTWKGRITGYSGAAGMTQALAGGYFLWDVVMCMAYMDIQGPGALAHGVSALIITMTGFVSCYSFSLSFETESPRLEAVVG